MTIAGQEELVPGRLFEGLEPQGIVVVAVSGGSDSLALLLLAHAWALPRDITLHAVTIDHGLRPEAAAEAAFVASLCDGLDIDHTTLAWEGVKPAAGVPEAARKARYALIEDFALEIGGDLVLTGHTADDQAETVWMRLQRETAGSSLGRGLAGMARQSLLPGGTLMARPLLGVSRRRLREYLASFPQSWVEDPSNHDVAYERVRVRRMLEGRPDLRTRMLGLSAVMGSWRAVLASDTAELLGHLARLHAGHVFRFDLQVALAAPRPVLVHATQVLLAAAGGSDRLAQRAKVEAMLSALASGESTRATLAGCVVEREGPALRFYREMRNLTGTFIDPGETVLWDGRLEVTNAGRGRIHIAPLTRDGLAATEKERNASVEGKPRAALHSSAMIRGSDGRIFLPTLEADGHPQNVRTRVAARAIEHFCPETDFPLLEWLREVELERRTRLGQGS